MSSSGKGQSFLEAPGGVQKAWDHAMSGSRVEAPRVIVEGLIDFDYEITLLTVRARKAGAASKRSSVRRSAIVRSRATMSRAGSRSR